MIHLATNHVVLYQAANSLSLSPSRLQSDVVAGRICQLVGDRRPPKQQLQRDLHVEDLLQDISVELTRLLRGKLPI
jgi:hypothetical protein